MKRWIIGAGFALVLLVAVFVVPWPIPKETVVVETDDPLAAFRSGAVAMPHVGARTYVVQEADHQAHQGSYAYENGTRIYLGRTVTYEIHDVGGALTGKLFLDNRTGGIAGWLYPVDGGLDPHQNIILDFHGEWGSGTMRLTVEIDGPHTWWAYQAALREFESQV